MADYATLYKKRLKARRHSVLIDEDIIKGLKLCLKWIVSRRFQGCTIAIDMLPYKSGNA